MVTTRNFERNLELIIKYLDTHPYCRLKVVIDANIICEDCTHLKNGCCNKSSKSIAHMDISILKRLVLDEGMIDLARNLFIQVNKILNLEDLKEYVENVLGEINDYGI